MNQQKKSPKNIPEDCKKCKFWNGTGKVPTSPELLDYKDSDPCPCCKGKGWTK